MIKVFNTKQEYNTYTNNGQNLVSGDLYYVLEDGGTHFTTNNIDGTNQNYDLVDGIPEGYIKPEGTAIFEQNVSNVDISNYAKATVNVPIPQGYIQPSGNKEITANGTNINVNEYATATVNVPIPEGYIQPSGGIIFIKNEDNVDIREYAVANVNVPQPTGNISLTENGSNIDIADYATATVNVPIPQGYIQPTGDKSITANGSNIDVAQYSTATVNVPIPQGYILPTGNKEITENGTNIDVAQYATATVNVAAQAKNYIVEGTEYDPTATYSGEFKATNLIKKVIIPNGYTSIGNNAFYGCSGLTTVDVAGSGADVEIPSSVTSFGQFAFSSCTGLRSLTIPSTVTSINYQFVDNIPLPCISFLSQTPPSISGSSYFNNWDNIIYAPSASVATYKTSFSGMTERIFPSPNVSGAEMVCVFNQSNVSLQPFGSRNWEFFKKVYINDVEVPISMYYSVAQNDVFRGVLYDQRLIPQYMFSYKNYVLKTITLPSTIEAIGKEAFANSSFVSITILATTPPTLGANALVGTNSNLIIYVPAESLETYQAASGWSTYASKIQAIPTT